MTTAYISGKHEHEEIVPIMRSYHETTVAVDLSDKIDSTGPQSRACGYSWRFIRLAQAKHHVSQSMA